MCPPLPTLTEVEHAVVPSRTVGHVGSTGGGEWATTAWVTRAVVDAPAAIAGRDGSHDEVAANAFAAELRLPRHGRRLGRAARARRDPLADGLSDAAAADPAAQHGARRLPRGRQPARRLGAQPDAVRALALDRLVPG
jgi:hypothetical protein